RDQDGRSMTSMDSVIPLYVMASFFQVSALTSVSSSGYCNMTSDDSQDLVVVES
ncbi:5674_t:CDS:1, partial [Acaulospora colombiana]